MDAQYNALGGVINVVTMGGGGRVPRHRLGLRQPLQAVAHRRTSARNLYEYSRPSTPTRCGPTQSYQLTLNVGGPIIKRKLWYRAHLRPAPGRGLPGQAGRRWAPPPTTSSTRPRQQHQPPGRLAPVLRPRHPPPDLAVGQHLARASSTTSTAATARLGVAENHQNQNAIFGVLGWDWYLSGNVITQLQAGFALRAARGRAPGLAGRRSTTPAASRQFSRHPSCVCTYDRNRPQHFNLNDNTIWYKADAYQLDKRYKCQVRPHRLHPRHRPFGQHEVKPGIQAQFNYRTRLIQTPGGQTFTDQRRRPAAARGPLRPDGQRQRGLLPPDRLRGRRRQGEGLRRRLLRPGPLVDPHRAADRHPRPARRLRHAPSTATAAR